MKNYVWFLKFYDAEVYKFSEIYFNGTVFGNLEKLLEKIRDILETQHQEYCECCESDNFKDCTYYRLCDLDKIKDTGDGFFSYVFYSEESSKSALIVSKIEIIS